MKKFMTYTISYENIVRSKGCVSWVVWGGKQSIKTCKTNYSRLMVGVMTIQ